jgi:hypothetical protein
LLSASYRVALTSGIGEDVDILDPEMRNPLPMVLKVVQEEDGGGE